MDEQVQHDESGLIDIDPVSGNEVPPGAEPEEVRDDVDAKLSKGEYVVPADVVKYFGVAYFEKLRDKAKKGMMEFEADGRIGGEEAPEDDFPFSEEELAVEVEEEVEGYNEGGLVDGTFDVAQPSYGGTQASFEGNSGQSSGITTKSYIDEKGNVRAILFINGKPATPIPDGYVPNTPENRAKTTKKEQNETQNTRNDDNDSGTGFHSQVRAQQREAQGEGGDDENGMPKWAEGFDFANASAEDAQNLAEARLKSDWMERGVQAAGLLAGGPLGGGIATAATGLRGVAEARGLAMGLQAAGNEEAANSVLAMVDERIKSSPISVRALEGMVATGARIGANITNNLGGGRTTPSATPTPPRSTAAPTGTAQPRSSGRTDSGSSGVANMRVTRASSAPPTRPSGLVSRQTPTAQRVSVPNRAPTQTADRAAAGRGRSAPPTRPTVKKESYEQKIKRGGGFNKGGFVQKRVAE